MAQQFRLRIHTLTDRANFVLHTAIHTATFAAFSYYMGSPLITLFATAAGILTRLKTLQKGKHYVTALFAQNMLPIEKLQLPPDKQPLPSIVKVLSKHMGLKKNAQIVSRPISAQELGLKLITARKEAELESAREKIILAMVVAHENKMFLTRHTFTALNLNKVCAIIAHELAHLAAKHQEQMLPSLFLKNIIAFQGLACIILAACANLSGAIALGIGLASYPVTGFILARHLYLRIRHEDNFKRIYKVSDSIGTAIFVTIAAATNAPEVILGWAVANAAILTSKLTHARLSRRHELQADRVGAESTQDPATIAAALRDYEAINRKEAPQTFEDSDYRQGPLISRLYKRVESLFSTHPHIERRCARLEKMAEHIPQPAVM